MHISIYICWCYFYDSTQFIHSSGKGHCVRVLSLSLSLLVKILWHLKIGTFHNPPRIDPISLVCPTFCLATIFSIFFFFLIFRRLYSHSHSPRVDVPVRACLCASAIFNQHHFTETSFHRLTCTH